jgi:hypothetical protein
MSGIHMETADIRTLGLNPDILERLYPGEKIQKCVLHRIESYEPQTTRFILERKMREGLQYVINVQREVVYEPYIPEEVFFEVDILKIVPDGVHQAENVMNFCIRECEVKPIFQHLNEVIQGKRNGLLSFGGLSFTKYDNSTNTLILNKPRYGVLHHKYNVNDRIQLPIPFPLFYEIFVLMQEENKSFTLHIRDTKTVLFVKDKNYNLVTSSVS